MKRRSASPAARARKIKMLLLDVDGVMTDGGIYYSADGVELKRFNAQDGYGISLAQANNLKIGIISGRQTPIVEVRAKALKIADVFQNASDKVAAMRDIQARYGLADDEFAYMGDDLFDLPLLQSVGFSAAPANGRPDVRRKVDYVTRAAGGDGAVRELIEFLLHARNGRSTIRGRVRAPRGHVSS